MIEATGRFRTRADVASVTSRPAPRKVILSAPAKGDEPADANVVLGVNFDDVYDPERHRIITNASCTTNCLAPVAKMLHETIGIRHGLMTTIHAYTADQNLLDGPHKDLRRARARRAQPRPDLDRRGEGARTRDPRARRQACTATPCAYPCPPGSIVDLTFEAERPTSARSQRRLRGRARTPAARGHPRYSEDPLVSSDIVGSPYSAIFDAPLTSVVDGTQVKVVAWYDNEWGYANRLVDLAERVMVAGPGGGVTMSTPTAPRVRTSTNCSTGWRGSRPPPALCVR